MGAGVGLSVVGGRLLQGRSNQGNLPQQTNSTLTPTPTPTSTPTSTSTSTPLLQTFNFETISVNSQGKISSRRNLKTRYFTEDLGNGVSLEMVEIPGDSLKIGSTAEDLGGVVILGRSLKTTDDKWSRGNEHPQHEVRVGSFFMGKYQVTQAQWKKVANLPQVKRELKAKPSNFKGDNRPVENISWNDAVEFCSRLSKHTGREYRLPSEAEWEYACRAGTTTAFHFGETITDDLANYDASDVYANEPKGQYRKETTPVGQFPANAFGLYDMHGNVWEWCLDDWHEDYEGAPTDGSAWINNKNDNHFFHIMKMRRGGSWLSTFYNCRSACRSSSSSVFRYDHIGFRVVLQK